MFSSTRCRITVVRSPSQADATARVPCHTVADRQYTVVDEIWWLRQVMAVVSIGVDCHDVLVSDRDRPICKSAFVLPAHALVSCVVSLSHPQCPLIQNSHFIYCSPTRPVFEQHKCVCTVTHNERPFHAYMYRERLMYHGFSLSLSLFLSLSLSPGQASSKRGCMKDASLGDEKCHEPQRESEEGSEQASAIL